LSFESPLRRAFFVPKIEHIMAKPALYINGEALDMGTLPSITVERHNPLLSEGQQSYAYPFTIPRTPRNERLLGFPARFERVYSVQKDYPCTLLCGHVQRIGSLHINSITRDSYDCSMTYDTARLLGDIGKKKLNELKWDSPDFDSSDQLFRAVLDTMEGKEIPLSEKVATFSLLVTLKENPTKDEIGYIQSLLNGCMIRRLPDYSFVLDIKSFKYVNDNEVVTLKNRFGTAPFLRVDYILRFIFETTLNYNLDFGQRAYNPLEHICLLHNCVDVIVDRYLRLRQLVPDCTVEDFVSSIENMFCSKFIVDSKTNTVRWVLWNDYLIDKRTPNSALWIPRPNVVAGGIPKPFVAELRPYLEGSHELEMLPRCAIKLTMQRTMSVDGKPSFFKVDTPEEFYNKEVEEIYSPSVFGHGTGKVDDVSNGMLYDSDDILSCNTFNYFNADIDSNSKDMPVAAEHIPTLRGSVTAIDTATEACPAYCFGLSFFNSSPPKKEDGAERADKDAKRPLAFAAYYYRNVDTGKLCVGTTIGERFGLAQSLRLHLPEGLFNNYHALRDAVIRSGAYRLTVKLDRTIAINEKELYLFDGQPVMVESVREDLGSDAPQTVALQTIKFFE
jgi:hypothetical protein